MGQTYDSKPRKRGRLAVDVDNVEPTNKHDNGTDATSPGRLRRAPSKAKSIAQHVAEARDLPKRRKLLGPLVHSSAFVVFFGPTGVGKSTFLMDMGMRIASGGGWADAPGANLDDRDLWTQEPRPGGERVLRVDLEMNGEDMLERLGNIDAPDNYQILLREDIPAEHKYKPLEYILQVADDEDFSVLEIDNLISLVPNSSKEDNVREACDAIQQHQEKRRRKGNPLAVVLAAHVLKGPWQQARHAGRPIDDGDLQGSSLFGIYAHTIISYQPNPENNRGSLLTIHKGRGAAARTLDGSCFVFHTDLTLGRNEVHYEGRMPVAHFFGRGKMTAAMVNTDRERIGEIADSMRTSQGWASTAAVFRQYKSEGGTRSQRSVADDLKVLGKTNPEPASTRASRKAREQHEQAIMQLMQDEPAPPTLLTTDSNVETNEHDTARRSEPPATTGAEIATASGIGGVPGGSLGAATGGNPGRRAAEADSARPAGL